MSEQNTISDLNLVCINKYLKNQLKKKVQRL